MACVLGIDTSAAVCSAAVWRDGAVLAAARAAMARGHAEALMPMIEDVMRAAGIAYPDLGAVAVTRGPGAFTGLRIGLAAARGLALAAGIPAIGISAFDAIAEAVPVAVRQERTLAIAIDTKRGDVYLRRYDAAARPLDDGGVKALNDVVATLPPGQIAIAGDGVAMLREVLSSRARETRFLDAGAPDAAIVARLGAAALAAGGPYPPPEPLYLRAPEATPLALQGKKR